MSIVDQHHHDVAITPACNGLNVSRATWYRRRAKKLKSNFYDATSLTNAARSFHPRRISCVDRQHVFAILCSDRFLDMTPRGVHAALLSQGTYLCSVRTMYQILAQNKGIRERRRIAAHPQTEIPRLIATRPNQVWTWDITKLSAAIGGYYNLYVILDLYSRCVVGWRLLRTESGAFAAMFVMETILTPGVDSDGLSIHADRGEHLQIQRIRQHALDRFWKEHPERFVRGRPRAPSLPDQVWINRPESPEQIPTKLVTQFAVS